MLDFLGFYNKSICLLLITLTSSCQTGYYLQSAYNQFKIMADRVPFTKALESPEVASPVKDKIKLAQSAKKFSVERMGLKSAGSYAHFVDLGRDYVTWVVNASENWGVKNYEWKYFWVGAMPYKGFFNPQQAAKEEQRLKSLGYDTFLRGVSAYSTLGWLNDPLLSTLVKYEDADFVETILHELVHSTIYIKNSSDFNERLAVFLGQKGAIDFYKEKEGPDSQTALWIKQRYEDELMFSKFITKEIQSLNLWYSKNPPDPNAKAQRLKLIQSQFEIELKPKLKTTAYQHFSRLELNNARLGLYLTYNADLSSFAELFRLVKNDYRVFLAEMFTLKNSKDPEESLRQRIIELRR